MGCDIHLYPEYRRRGDWYQIQVPELEVFSNGFSIISNFYGYRHRNYDLFGILAGVRAGCEPISAPRGLPDDVSPGVRAEAESWGCDGHSHSYLSLEELLSFDWDRPFCSEERWVDAEVYESWDKRGYAPSSCGGASYGKAYPEEEYLARKQAGTLAPGKLFVITKFRMPYREAAGSDFFRMLSRLKSLNLPSADLRIVFWFDN